jgi:uncharacterized protein YbjQ (UPF0145 family)
MSTKKCDNCGSTIGGMFGSQLIQSSVISKYKALIDCPDVICTKCDGGYTTLYEQAVQKKAIQEVRNNPQYVKSQELKDAIGRIHVVSTEVLPNAARYKLIDMVSFQSTLGTGFFSEFGSDISNILGTESKMINKKMGESLDRCKNAMRALAYELGANAIIGVSFQLSTNTRDATTVAAQGTAVFIENIDEVFHRPNVTNFVE